MYLVFVVSRTSGGKRWAINIIDNLFPFLSLNIRTSGCATQSEVVMLVNLPGGKEGIHTIGN